MRWSWLAGGFVGWAFAACGVPGAFVCEQDSQCEQGICQLDVGYCSFPDPTCTSGQRFGAYSGDLAEACVGDEPASTGLATTEATTTSLATSPLTLTSDTSDTSDASDDGGSTTTGTEVPTCPPTWWDCGWSHRLALDVIWEGTSQADFPVRVALTPARLDLAEVASDGADLRVVTDAGVLLPHELERSTSEDQAELWVRVPQLVAGTRLWLYWGNPDAADAHDPASVWSEGYAAVWHLDPALDDATGEHPLDDLATADVDGRIGRARAFDGSSSLLRPFDEADFLSLFSEEGGTVSAWILLSGWGQGGFGRIIDHAATNTGAEGWHVAVSGAGELHPASFRFSLDYDVQRGTWETGPDTLALGTWQHVAVTFRADDPAAEPSLYVDGELAPIHAVSLPMGAPNLVSPHPATIGAMATGGARFFDGVIDELRLSTVLRSPEWIAAEALAGADQLLEYGTAESLPRP